VWGLRLDMVPAVGPLCVGTPDPDWVRIASGTERAFLS